MTHAEILQRIAKLRLELAELGQGILELPADGISIPGGVQPWTPPPGGYVTCYYACSFPGVTVNPPTITLTSTPPPDADK